MARIFLIFYVGVGILVILLSLILTLCTGEAHHYLSDNDWLVFIIACGALAIVERMSDV